MVHIASSAVVVSRIQEQTVAVPRSNVSGQERWEFLATISQQKESVHMSSTPDLQCRCG